jgi:hypothetical protein
MAVHAALYNISTPQHASDPALPKKMTKFEELPAP